MLRENCFDLKVLSNRIDIKYIIQIKLSNDSGIEFNSLLNRNQLLDMNRLHIGYFDFAVQFR